MIEIKRKERRKQLILPGKKGQEDVYTENNAWVRL